MTEEFLLETIGDARDSYIWQARQLTPGKQKIPARKLWLLAAAVALLALTATACAVVYARIHMKLVQHNAEPTAQVQSTDSVKNVLTSCYPQSLPEGYSLWEGFPIDRSTRGIRYRNDAGETIRFNISTRNDFSEVTTLPPAKEESLTISGQEATLMTSDGGMRALRWRNAADGYYVYLSTMDMQVDLIAVAESVAPGEELPLSFLYHRGEPWDIWYPQLLPEGYHCTDVTPIEWGTQSVRYYNDEKSQSIRYQISTGKDLSNLSTNEDGTWEKTVVAGQPAKLLVTSSGKHVLFWENQAEGFNAMLETGDETVDLTAVAESVALGEPLEISSNYLGPDYTIELEQDPSKYVGWEPVYPRKVPEGFEITFVDEPSYGQQSIYYEDAGGDAIYFTLYFRLGQWGRQFDGLGQPEQVDINGHTGYRMENGQLIWTDEARGFGFALLSNADVDLLAMARSVAPGPELTPTDADKTKTALEQLGDYQITALPKGMEEDGLTGRPLEDGDGWYSYVSRWYFNKKTNQEIYFEYESYVTNCFTAENALRMLAGDSAQMAEINGCPGATLQNGTDASVVWLVGTPEKGVSFKLYSSDFSAEELLEIAESVRK